MAAAADVADARDVGLEMMETFSPSATEIDFLTEKINEESRTQNITSDAYPFGIFLRQKTDNNNFRCSNDDDATRTSLSSSSAIIIEEIPSVAKSPTMATVTEADEKDDTQVIIGGCNGFIIYGSIYTDQLWVDQQHRGKGLGKRLMDAVHELGRRKNCKFATVGTMNFQNALKFYEGLGYVVEFERGGYDNNGKMIHLKKDLANK